MKKQTVPRPSLRKLIVIGSLAILIGMIVVWIFVRPVHWRNQTTFQENISYCGTTNQQQTLDFYRPKRSGEQLLPLIVYIHGGGWRGGTKNNGMINTYGPIFIKHNIAVASLNYRLNSAHPYPDQNDDIACALAYLESHAAELHIDTSQLLYFGESAGGELAAFAALNTPYKNYRYTSPVGVIDFYGVTDFTKILHGSRPDYNARRYLGTQFDQKAAEASPITYVRRDAPRFLIIHGDADKVVPPAQSAALHDALSAAGVNTRYLTIPQAGHGFSGPELTPADYKIILDHLNSFLRETVSR